MLNVLSISSNYIQHHSVVRMYRDFTSYNKVLKLEFTQSLAAGENKYQTVCSRKSERHGLDIFTRVAGLFRVPFEEGWLMWRQCSFCFARARGCLPLGTLSVCACACVCVCVFEKRCTELQPRAIPDYPLVCDTHTDTRLDTHMYIQHCPIWMDEWFDPLLGSWAPSLSVMKFVGNHVTVRFCSCNKDTLWKTDP